MHVRCPETEELVSTRPSTVNELMQSKSSPVSTAGNNHGTSNNVNRALPTDSLSADRSHATTPFIKSRSLEFDMIETGMLGTVDRQLNSLMLVSNGEKLAYSGSNSQERLIINVSGKMFETTMGALSKFPHTLLGNPERRKEYYDDSRNEYYFNRSQIAFDAILYFYQSEGDIYQPEGLPDTLFERELDFYELVDRSVPIESTSPEPEFLHMEIVRKSRGIKKWRAALWGFVEFPKSSIPSRIWASTNMIVILISVVNLIWESLPKYRADTSIETFFIVDTVCVSYFTLDLVLRSLSTPTVCSFVRNVLNWFDLLAIIPFYVELIIGRENASGLACFRILRLFRITRLFKLIRHSARMMLMMEVVSNCLSELVMLFITWVMGTLIFGTIMFYVEESDGSDFKSILHACWWAAVTMTTVGYGDLAPTTPLGKVIGSIILFLSMIYIALPMTLIVSKFSQTLGGHQEKMDAKRRKYKKMPSKEKNNVFS